MPEQTPKDNYKWVLNGIRMSIEHSVRNLETITSFLSGKFPEFDGTKLPEYQKAIDAITKYKEAVLKVFRKELEIPE